METTLTPVTSDDFVRAMGRAATPVTIVTAIQGGEAFGQTVSAVSRVSDEPPVLSVCINRRSPINTAIASGATFNVSVLGHHHSAVADSFAGRHQEHRPRFGFVDGEWLAGTNDLPVFGESVASFECQLIGVNDIGSHHLYLGQVLRVTHTDVEPLLHLRGSYRTLAAISSEGHHS